MRTFLQETKGYVALGAALISCPCHLPLTLGLLIGATAGTTLGAWISQNTLLIYLAFTVSFFGWLWLGLRWLEGRSIRSR
ncbi:MAG: mercury resistance protein [Chloroflexi bacterium]|nr:mercury resistance protein [Chloroflexota bacterium]